MLTDCYLVYFHNLFTFQNSLNKYTFIAFIFNIVLLVSSILLELQFYFQNIADPKDIAATSSVSFTINHIAAVVIPAALGLVWVVSHSAVFLIGTGFALCSLLLSQNIPTRPVEGHEVVWGHVRADARSPLRR